MAKLKYRPKNGLQENTSRGSVVDRITNGEAKHKRSLQTRKISAGNSKNGPADAGLMDENERLRGENKSLRSRLLQSVANSDMGSVKSQTAQEKDDEDETFMMLQEYIVENENLRARNSELVILQEQVEKNYQHIQMQNDDLKTRITHLERQVLESQGHATHTPGAGDVIHRESAKSPFPQAQGASSSRGANLLNSHERFLKKMNDSGSASDGGGVKSPQQARQNAFLRGSPRLPQNFPNELSSILSRPAATPPSREGYGDHGSASQQRKKAALASTNKIVPTKGKKSSSGSQPTGGASGVDKNGYLRKYRSKSPALDRGILPNKPQIQEAAAESVPHKSPRQVAIIKPKPKNTQSEYHSYLTILEQKKGNNLPMASSTQQPKNNTQRQNNNNNNYLSGSLSQEGPMSVIKSRPVPPHKRNSIGPFGNTSFKVSPVPGSNPAPISNSVIKAKPAPKFKHIHNAPANAWDAQIQSLSQMNNKMRSEIRSLEYQIHSLNKS